MHITSGLTAQPLQHHSLLFKGDTRRDQHLFLLGKRITPVSLATHQSKQRGEHLRQGIQALRTAASTRLHGSQRQNKRDNDKLVCVTLTFTPGGIVLADRHKRFAAATHFAKSMANAMYDRLLTQAFAPFHEKLVQPNTLKSDEDGISHTISVHRAAHAPTRDCHRTAFGDTEMQLRDSDRHISKHETPYRTDTTDETTRKYIKNLFESCATKI